MHYKITNITKKKQLFLINLFKYNKKLHRLFNEAGFIIQFN